MSFLTDQIRDNREKKLVFPEFRRLRKEDILREKEEYEKGITFQPGWAGRDYKVYPSSISFGMCLHEFFIKMNSGTFQGIEDEKAKYRTEAGKYKHQEIQDTMKRSPLLYTLPRIPQDLALELIPKLIKEWPEVPIRDHVTGISGKADLIMRYEDKPVLVDIKTTSLPDRQWHELTVAANYKTQLCVYAHFMNQYGYYPDPIERVGIAFYNLSGELGDTGAEREVYFKFDTTLQDKTKWMLEEIAKIRDQYMKGGKPDKCVYKKCRTHGKENSADD